MSGLTLLFSRSHRSAYWKRLLCVVLTTLPPLELSGVITYPLLESPNGS